MIATTDTMTTGNQVKRKPLSPDEIKARDLFLAAIHEAGHVIVAKHFGYEANAWVFMVDRQTDLAELKACKGQSVIFASPTPFHNAVIGCGGIVAEEVCADRQAWDVDELVEWTQDGIVEPSDADWAAIKGHAQQKRAWQLAWRIVERDQIQVLALARELITTVKDVAIAGKAIERLEAKEEDAEGAAENGRSDAAVTRNNPEGGR